MFRLTREVRFAINRNSDDQLAHAPTNSYGGYPTLTGFGQFFTLQVGLAGELDPQIGYLRNIKEIDQVVRREVIPIVENAIRTDAGLAPLMQTIYAGLIKHWPPGMLHSLRLSLSPFLSVTQLGLEYPMHTRLSQRFEFSASHRLFNPAFSDDQNRATYGKCSHPSGHGHNYELEVTLRGTPAEKGLLVDVPAFETVVQKFVLEHFDHKNLNVDVEEFKTLVPSCENIAMVIYRRLKNRFTGIGAELAAVTVWETPKTSCEYTE